MFLKKNPKNEKWFAYTVAACSAVVLFVALSNLSVIWGWVRNLFHVLSPIIEGIVFAYIMGPVCELFERTLFRQVKQKNVAKVASVATGVIVVICVFIILLVALVPQLIDSIMTFASNFGSYANQMEALLDELSFAADERGVDISSFVDMGNNFVNDLISSIPQRINVFLAASYSFGVSVANIAIAFVLAVYFLLDADNLLAGIRKLAGALFTHKRYNAIAEFWGRCNKILIRYITFDIVDGFIVGILNFVFMMVLSMPYSVLISVIVGVTNLAPTFGPIAGGVFGALILLLAKPVDALAFVLFTLVLQTVDGYVIKPRLFGSSLGVPAVWILITIIVGGNIFGVIGILLAIPFAAIMTYVYRDMLEMRIDERRNARKEEEREK